MSTFGMSELQMAKYVLLRERGFDYSHTEETGSVIMELHEHIYDAKLLRERVSVDREGMVDHLVTTLP